MEEGRGERALHVRATKFNLHQAGQRAGDSERQIDRGASPGSTQKEPIQQRTTGGFLWHGNKGDSTWEIERSANKDKNGSCAR